MYIISRWAEPKTGTSKKGKKARMLPSQIIQNHKREYLCARKCFSVEFIDRVDESYLFCSDTSLSILPVNESLSLSFHFHNCNRFNANKPYGVNCQHMSYVLIFTSEPTSVGAEYSTLMRSFEYKLWTIYFNMKGQLFIYPLIVKPNVTWHNP